MPDLRIKLICWTSVWLSISTLSIIIAVLPLHRFIPAKCEVLSSKPDDKNDDVQRDNKNRFVAAVRKASPSPAPKCEPELELRVTLKDNNERFIAVFTIKMLCKEQKSYLSNKQKGATVPCWYPYNNKTDIRIVSETKDEDLAFTVRLSKKLRTAAIGTAVLFGISFLLSFGCVFKTDLMRCCPRFVLTFFMNIHTRISRRSNSQAPPPPPDEEIINRIVRRPPIATSRRRISALVETAKLSNEEAHALRIEGWSCCICLEEPQAEDGCFQSISRLQCMHATHSECLRAWLEKGRAVCCLCNAEVFPDGLKDAAGSSGRSFGSAEDRDLIGSLEVERTEGAPSSPATSVFIEISQPRSAEQQLSDDQGDA